MTKLNNTLFAQGLISIRKNIEGSKNGKKKNV